ncbi:glycosyltransferase family 2 protein [Bacillus paranthracis]|uniref:Glycosyl transferase, group 2 family protein n=1 Tax=Bacillus cereus (strain Q1) TaxID=361100 RepID=B9J5T9_BACCQ|nr:MULTISPECIES: glycosyltransferase family A protein [Bacillus cereus group]ACM15510.1 glycosyl transferase, group 2 family protein [Bacillus cereus Q1]MDA1978720.1 glycosyltransferase family A protein [Bacillus cereus]MBY5229511.1 hypothetical protein [Bacillus paranthracis]MCC2387547.1 glycosyltransferase family 2 protein [Bacillus pacificus]MCY9251900.1 glycosyltransferase family 2 protein [Bacillus paranthracis]
MKISLVMATIGRLEDIRLFLESLKKQTYNNFELIVVDQNEHDRVENLIEGYKKLFTIKYIKSSPGLSKARNIGLEKVEGDIVAFPDDDCKYRENTLQEVMDFLKENPQYHFVTGMCNDDNGNISVSKFNEKPCEINKNNAWVCGVSVTLFCKKEILERVSGFDEELGAGSGTIFGSGEETDFILRCLGAGFKGYYVPKIIVLHENPLIEYNEKTCKRAYYYGAGYLRVLNKHNYHPLKKFEAIIKAGIGIFISIYSIGKMKYYYASFKGRIKGYLAR